MDIAIVYFFLSYLLLLVLSFYFKIGNQSRLQRLIERLLGTKRKSTCNVQCDVCVHNIVLFVMVSRFHHDNISNTLADQSQF